MNTQSSPQRQANILVADDTPENLKLLARLLGRSGYAVRSAISGSLALQAARLLPPDLILLDIRMPQMDGYEVCQQLKADEKLKHIPVIFISAHNEFEDKVKAFQAGGVDYIAKPFQAEELLARVSTHLELQRLRQELGSRAARLTTPVSTELERHVAERTRQLETRLLELEDLYNRAPCGYHSLDPEGVLFRINDTELGWLGYSREEVFGQKFTEFLAEHNRDPFAQRVIAATASEKSFNFDLELRRKDGHLLPVSMCVMVVRDPTGKLIQTQYTVLDNTERKKADVALRQALAAADEANRIKKESLASLAHELRTPMNAIIGYTQMLQRDISLTESARSQLKIIARSSQNLLTLINSNFGLSGSEMGHLTESPTEPAGAESLERLTVEDMSAVSPELRRQLYNALVGANYEEVNQVIHKISPTDTDLAGRLKNRADRFAAESLIQLLEPFLQRKSE